jgi:hypothetical protein
VAVIESLPLPNAISQLPLSLGAVTISSLPPPPMMLPDPPSAKNCRSPLPTSTASLASPLPMICADLDESTTKS